MPPSSRRAGAGKPALDRPRSVPEPEGDPPSARTAVEEKARVPTAAAKPTWGGADATAFAGCKPAVWATAANNTACNEHAALIAGPFPGWLPALALAARLWRAFKNSRCAASVCHIFESLPNVDLKPITINNWRRHVRGGGGGRGAGALRGLLDNDLAVSCCSSILTRTITTAP